MKWTVGKSYGLRSGQTAKYLGKSGALAFPEKFELDETDACVSEFFTTADGHYLASGSEDPFDVIFDDEIGPPSAKYNWWTLGRTYKARDGKLWKFRGANLGNFRERFPYLFESVSPPGNLMTVTRAGHRWAESGDHARCADDIVERNSVPDTKAPPTPEAKRLDRRMLAWAIVDKLNAAGLLISRFAERDHAHDVVFKELGIIDGTQKVSEPNSEGSVPTPETSLWKKFQSYENELCAKGAGCTKDQMNGAAVFCMWAEKNNFVTTGSEEAAYLEFCRLIEVLTDDEGDEITICAQNVEPPHQYAIDCSGSWTNWEPRRYEAKDFVTPLRLAVAAKKASAKSHAPKPTHRCKKCGAYWKLWQPDEAPGIHSASWSLVSDKCGKCCDNQVMGDQIELLAPAPAAPPDVVNETVKDMSVRDLFAASALQGLLANPGGPIQTNPSTGWGLTNCDHAFICGQAYLFADDMLKLRGKPK